MAETDKNNYNDEDKKSAVPPQQNLPFSWEESAEELTDQTSRQDVEEEQQEQAPRSKVSTEKQTVQSSNDQNPAPQDTEQRSQKQKRHGGNDDTSSLGEILREARENCDLDVDQVAELTRIPRRVIENLEKERFSELPPLLYSKSYLDKLCRKYGIEDTGILYKKLSEKSLVHQPASAPPGNFRVAQEEGSGTAKVQYYLQSETEPEKKRWVGATPSMIGGIIAAALLFILVSSVFAIRLLPSTPQEPSSSSDESPAAAHDTAAEEEIADRVDLEKLIIPQPLPLKELEIPDSS